MGKVTLKELSKILGISVSTVSKALNDSVEISATTKTRVLELAREYDYQPNPIAKRLKLGKTFTIAVVIPSIQDSFFVRVLHGIEEAISNTDYNLITCSTRNLHSKEIETINNLANGVVDGYIIAPAKETLVKQRFNHFNSIIGSNKPVIFIDRGIGSFNSCLIKSNDKKAVYDATIKLIEKGRKKIAIISYNYNINTGRERIEGYFQALKERQIDVKPSLVIKPDKTNSEEDLKKLLLFNQFDAIICTDEQSSFDVLRKIKRSNLKIPEDISVIGYMDENVAKNLTPQLSTINQHRKTIGKNALEQLIKTIEDGVLIEKPVKINSSLELRESF